MRFDTLVKLVVAACVAFAIALVAVVKTIDVQQYRMLVTDLLHAATGRNVEVRGDFQLALSFSPRIVATDVAMANVPGARRPELLKVARIEAEIGLFALLRREVEVLNLTLVEPDLALDIDESGRGNWHLTPPTAESGRVRWTAGTPMTSLRIHAVTVEGGRLVLQDRSARSVSVLNLSHVTVSAADTATPIAFTAKGQFGKLPLEVMGTVGSFAELDRRGRPFPIKLQAAAGSNRAVVEGSIGTLATLSDLDLRVSLQGNDVAEAARLLGRDVPALGPFRAALKVTGSWAAPALPEIEAAVGRKDLVRLAAKGSIDRPWVGRGVQLAVTAESETTDKLSKLYDLDVPLKAPAKATARLADTDDGWHFSDVKASVGKSDLAGEIAVATAGPRPTLTAGVTSRLVDLADFGLKPVQPLPKGKGEALFRDDVLLPLSGITTFDLDVTWRAEKVASQGAPLFSSPGEAMLMLRGGVLMMRPFTTAAEGIISVPSLH